jgi:hypothetical protein
VIFILEGEDVEGGTLSMIVVAKDGVPIWLDLGLPHAGNTGHPWYPHYWETSDGTNLVRPSARSDQ